MNKYTFTSSMREISGFGGSYEDACRKMVIAGVEWCEANPTADIKVGQFRNIYGIISEETPDTKTLVKVMCDASGDPDGVTGAMVQATVNHVVWIRMHTWDAYVVEMSKK